jgi:hypothetical protein
MKARLVVLGLVVVLCLVLPGLVVPSVGAGSESTARKYFIKSIYYVRHTFANPDVVMEWYYCPATHTFKWHRGAFERYDAYTYFFGGGGKWIELYFYWK